MQSNRLIDRAQIVKAVWPQRADAQAEVDLGEGTDRDGHGVMIVTTEDAEDTEGLARWSLIPDEPCKSVATSFSCGKS